MIYAGKRIFNGNNLIAVIFILGAMVFYIKDPSNNFPLILIPIILLMTAATAFYFEITTDQLIVKNYMIPFLNIYYKLNEITQIRFLGTSGRSSATARVKIMRGDKRSMPFPVSSLRTEDWQQFVNHLSEKKIPVEIESAVLKNTIGIPEE